MDLDDGTCTLFAPETTVNMRVEAGHRRNSKQPTRSQACLFTTTCPKDLRARSASKFWTRREAIRQYSSEESDFERCLLHNMDPRSPISRNIPPPTRPEQVELGHPQGGFQVRRGHDPVRRPRGPGRTPETTRPHFRGNETREVEFDTGNGSRDYRESGRNPAMDGQAGRDQRSCSKTY